jgi:regulator of microtubule dynamics protein 3
MQGHRAWCVAAIAAVLAPPAAFAAGAFAQAESLYAAGQLAPARAAYLEVLAAEPTHFRALYRVSRAESELGEDSKGEEQRRLVGAAVEHARAAVTAAPDSAQGHLALAVALGRQALKEGAKTRLALSREIKSEVDRAITIDPGIGRAYHVRALWNRKIASLNFLERAAANTVLGGVPEGATMQNAVSDLQKAIELEPRYVNHHLELGRTLIEMDRKADARHELEQAVALPATSNPRDPRYQDEARELLKKLPKRE